MKKKIDLVEEARQLRMQAEALEKKVLQAKGTQEIHKAAPAYTKATAYAEKLDQYFIGDDGPTEQLMAVVQQLLTEHPMTFQDLLATTGARDNRVKGVIMRLQREGVRVINIGLPMRAVWFIPNDEVLERILKTKRGTSKSR